VKKSLQPLPGVTKVEVDFKAKTATCFVEDVAKFDTDAAIKAIEKSGKFKAKLISS